MKEIKFRAWDKKKKEWADINEWSVAGPNATITNKNHGALIPSLTLHNDDSYEWCQYTDLKDKSGKEIYEGDIFKRGDQLGKVVFEDGCFVFRCTNMNMSLTMRDHDSSEAEVIGNIYEHESLLNENKK